MSMYKKTILYLQNVALHQMWILGLACNVSKLNDLKKFANTAKRTLILTTLQLRTT